MSNKKHNTVKTIQPQTQDVKVETVIDETTESTVDTVETEVVDDTPVENTIETEEVENTVEVEPVVDETPVVEEVVTPVVIKEEPKTDVVVDGDIYLKIVTNRTEINFNRVAARLEKAIPSLVYCKTWIGTKDTDTLVGPYKTEKEAMVDRKILINKGLRATLTKM